MQSVSLEDLTLKQKDCYEKVIDFMTKSYVMCPILTLSGSTGVGKRTVLRAAIQNSKLEPFTVYDCTKEQIKAILFNGGGRIGDTKKVFVFENPTNLDCKCILESMGKLGDDHENRVIIVTSGKNSSSVRKVIKKRSSYVTLWNSSVRDMKRIVQKKKGREYTYLITSFDGDIRNTLLQVEFNSINSKRSMNCTNSIEKIINPNVIAYNSCMGTLGKTEVMNQTEQTSSLLRENLPRTFTTDLSTVDELMGLMSDFNLNRSDMFVDSLCNYVNHSIKERNILSGIRYCTKCDMPIKAVKSNKHKKTYFVCDCDIFYTQKRTRNIEPKQGRVVSNRIKQDSIQCKLCPYRAFSKKQILSHVCPSGNTELSKCFGKEEIRRFNSNRMKCRDECHRITSHKVYKTNDYMLRGNLDLKRKRESVLNAISNGPRRKKTKTSCNTLAMCNTFDLICKQYKKDPKKYSWIEDDYKRVVRIGLLEKGKMVSKVDCYGCLSSTVSDI